MFLNWPCIAFRLWLVVTAIAAIVFAAMPGLDLAVSGLFHGPDGFAFDDEPEVQRLRHVLWGGIIAVFLAALAGLVLSIPRGRFRSVPRATWEWAVLLYLLGPVLAVDVLFKSFWGRARPATVFEGEAAFTPFWRPATQCADNCSFVSGEGSGATAACLVVLGLTARMRRGPARSLLRWGVVGLAGLTIAMRVALGRHFVSDSVFAVLLVTGIALALRLWPRYARVSL